MIEKFWESLDDWNKFLNENPLIREFDETGFVTATILSVSKVSETFISSAILSIE